MFSLCCLFSPTVTRLSDTVQMFSSVESWGVYVIADLSASSIVWFLKAGSELTATYIAL